MPVFACRWPSGDVSFVMAPHKEAAIERLDEIGDAEGCPVMRIARFQIHLTLTGEGHFHFEGWGEDTEDFVWKKLYPRLDEAHRELFAERPETDILSPDEQERIRRAVQEERERVRAKEGSEPQTLVGKDIKRVAGIPTSLVNKIVRQAATEQLKKFKPKGKKRH